MTEKKSPAGNGEEEEPAAPAPREAQPRYRWLGAAALGGLIAILAAQHWISLPVWHAALRIQESLSNDPTIEAQLCWRIARAYQQKSAAKASSQYYARAIEAFGRAGGSANEVGRVPARLWINQAELASDHPEIFSSRDLHNQLKAIKHLRESGEENQAAQLVSHVVRYLQAANAAGSRSSTDRSRERAWRSYEMLWTAGAREEARQFFRKWLDLWERDLSTLADVLHSSCQTLSACLSMGDLSSARMIDARFNSFLAELPEQERQSCYESFLNCCFRESEPAPIKACCFSRVPAEVIRRSSLRSRLLNEVEDFFTSKRISPPLASLVLKHASDVSELWHCDLLVCQATSCTESAPADGASVLGQAERFLGSRKAREDPEYKRLLRNTARLCYALDRPRKYQDYAERFVNAGGNPRALVKLLVQLGADYQRNKNLARAHACFSDARNLQKKYLPDTESLLIDLPPGSN